MKKYYIYLNGERYMEMPEQYGIKQDVYMNYSDLIERALKDKGVGAVAIPYSKKIELLKKIITNPRFTNTTIKHELTHIKQIQDIANFSLEYKKYSKLFGYGGNPLEIEARQWSHRGSPLHRVGKFDIDYQKQLERWQKKSPRTFAKLAEEQKRRGGSKEQKWETAHKRYLREQEPARQSRLKRALEKIRTTLE